MRSDLAVKWLSLISIKSKQVANSWTVLKVILGQKYQSLNEIPIYILQTKSATKGDFFHIFLSLFRVGAMDCELAPWIANGK